MALELLSKIIPCKDHKGAEEDDKGVEDFKDLCTEVLKNLDSGKLIYRFYSSGNRIDYFQCDVKITVVTVLQVFTLEQQEYS